jgi:hypothetical protein
MRSAGVVRTWRARTGSRSARGHWTAVQPTTPARTLRGWLRRWPTAAGIGLAGFMALDLSGGSDLAPVLVVLI